MKTGMLTDEHKGGRKPVLSIEYFDFLDERMEANNELSVQELQYLIKERFGLELLGVH